MGAYLSEPITEKVSSDEVGERLSCGASSMQGWRLNQEDAHNCIIEFDKNTSLFAVYDGHGGHEVALYCSQHLPDFLKSVEAYKTNDLEKALIDAFIDFDATLATPDIVAILKELAGPKDKEGNVDGGDGNSSEEENENVNDLYEEASMPLEQVMEKYQNQQVNKLQKESGDKAPSSPYLRGKGSNSGRDLDAGAGSSGESGSSKEEVPSKEQAEEITATNGETSPHKPAKEIESGDSNKEEAVVKQNGDVDKEVTKNGEHPTEKTEDSPSKKGKGKASPVKRSPRIKPICLKDKLNLDKKDIQQIYSAILTANVDDDSDDTDEDDEHDDTFHAEAEPNSSDEEAEVDAEEDENEASESEEEDEEEDDDEDDMQMNIIEEPGFDSGCTAVVALLRDNDLYVANAGDSRCIVSRNGKVIEMSFDHKPETEEEFSRITKAGGKVTSDGRVNGGLNLSRALGDHAYKQNKELPAKEQMITALPDISKISIDPKEDEFMVLACDGIWNFMSNEEVIDFVGSRLNDGKHKLSEICEEMFDHCLAPNTVGDGTGCDNMTAIIVQFKKNPEDESKVSVVSGGSKRAASPTTTSSNDDSSSNKRAKVEGTSETKPESCTVASESTESVKSN